MDSIITSPSVIPPLVAAVLPLIRPLIQLVRRLVANWKIGLVVYPGRLMLVLRRGDRYWQLTTGRA